MVTYNLLGSFLVISYQKSFGIRGDGSEKITGMYLEPLDLPQIVTVYSGIVK